MQDPQKHHYDVISYHCVSKLAHFVEHDIGYQPSKFQCSRMSGSNFMEGGGKDPQCYNEIRKPIAYGVKANNLHLHQFIGIRIQLKGNLPDDDHKNFIQLEKPSRSQNQTSICV